MTTGHIYWTPICELAKRPRCWSRASVTDGPSQWTTDWGQLLITPVPGYLEVSEGPYTIRQFDWVQLSTITLHGGLAGRPLKFVDISEEILMNAKQLDRPFEIRDELWSMLPLFENQPLKVLHFTNPFAASTGGHT